MRLDIRATDAHARPVVAPPLSWRSGDGVSADGATLAGVTAGTSALTLRSGTATATVTVTVVDARPSSVWVDRDAPLQTIVGWEATAQIGQVECPGYETYRDTVLDRAVDELGINRLRLEVRTQSEHSRDWFGELRTKKIDAATWVAHRYDAVNDDDDPNHAASGRFHFTELDHTYQHVVKPIEERLLARGETLWLNLTLVGFGALGFAHRSAPTEYAELMIEAVRYLDRIHDRRPESIEAILEPDLAGWTPTETARAIAALRSRLDADGYDAIRIAGPSTKALSKANDYFDALVNTPGARVDELVYHRYAGTWPWSRASLADRRVAHGVPTAMLEHIGAGGATLHEDLTELRVSSWQQFAVAFCTDEDDGSAYYRVGPRGVELSKTARELRHYFWAVRRGAVVHVATSNDDDVHPVAFRNRDGRWVVVLRTVGPADVRIMNLPTARYDAWFTSASGTETALSPEGADLTVSIPSAGFVTVFAK